MPRPIIYPDFATAASGSNIATPDTPHQTNGFTNEFVPRQWLNHLFRYNSEWVRWLDEITQALNAGSGNGLSLLNELVFLERKGDGLKYGWGRELSTRADRYIDVTEGRGPASTLGGAAYSFDSYSAFYTAMSKDIRSVWALGVAGQGCVPSGLSFTPAEYTFFVFSLRNPTTGVTDLAVDIVSAGTNIAADANITSAGFTQRFLVGIVLGYNNGGSLSLRQLNTYGGYTSVNYPAVTETYSSASGQFIPKASVSQFALYASAAVYPKHTLVELEITLAGTETNSITFASYGLNYGLTVAPGETKRGKFVTYNGIMSYAATGTTGEFTTKLISYEKLQQSSYLT